MDLRHGFRRELSMTNSPFATDRTAPCLERHLPAASSPETAAPLFKEATGGRLRPNNFWII